MLAGAEQVLRWRVRPLVNRALDDGRELLAEELLLAGKLVERDVHQCSTALRSYAVSIAFLVVALITPLGGIAALLIRLFADLSVDEVLLGMAAVCFVGGYVAEKSARSGLKNSFRAPKEMAEELTGV